MPTYEVRRVKPIMVSVTTEAASEDEALWFAQQAWVEDVKDDAAYEVSRQPFAPDDTGDARSETRSEWSEGDVADDAAEAFRWGYGGDPSRSEGADE